jgi:class 3 adenylate cyclase
VAASARSGGEHRDPLREARVGWVGPAVVRCADLCDTAEGGQIFMSQATASLLEDEALGDLEVRDVGEVQTRRTERPVRAYELVFPDGPR